MCSEIFIDLSGLYISKIHFSHAFYFIFMCIIFPKLTLYVEVKELWMNTYNLHL